MESPPRAPRRPHILTAHGDERSDDWYWLQDRTDPEVIAYLDAENAYTDEVLAPLKPLQERLYAEMRARIQETDASAPNRKGPWWYYSRTVEGLQYAIHCRRADPRRELTVDAVSDAIASGAPGEEILLDENEAAGASEYFALGVFDVSPDHTMVAYGTDVTGGESYVLRFRDLTTGTDLSDEISGVYYSSAWSTDSRTFFYTRTDDAMRPWQIWRHRVGDAGPDRLDLPGGRRALLRLRRPDPQRALCDRRRREQDDLGGPFPRRLPSRRPTSRSSSPAGRGSSTRPSTPAIPSGATSG